MYFAENLLILFAKWTSQADNTERVRNEISFCPADSRKVGCLCTTHYQRLKPVYDAFQKAKDKTSFRAKHEAELVIFDAAKSNLLAMQGGGKLPSLKSLQAEQERLSQEQQRLYDERASLKKQAKQIDTIKANVDMFLSLGSDTEVTKKRTLQLE